VMTYTDDVSQLLGAMQGQRMTLNQLVRRSGIPRNKVIAILARLIRFRVAQWDYAEQQFVFSLCGQ